MYHHINVRAGQIAVIWRVARSPLTIRGIEVPTGGRAIAKRKAIMPIVPIVSSDPHAWLRPLYARLRDQKFGLLSPAHQFEALAKAIEEESPAKAASMREWSADAQIAMLKWLTDVTDEHPNPTNQIELWRVRKGERELQCRAVCLPTGIDVRLMEGNDFRRTQLVRDSIECEKLSHRWRAALVERSWSENSVVTD